MIGIYSITRDTDSYIGSSHNIPARWSSHKCDLNRGRHGNRYLQRAWSKYGADAFTFTVIESCSSDDLIAREQYYMDTLQPKYNLRRVAVESNVGVKFSQASRKKVSDAARRRSPHTPEHRKNISLGLKGNTNHLGISWAHTDESKANISKALQGHVVSEATRQKLKYTRTPETRAKMSAAAKRRCARISGGV